MLNYSCHSATLPLPLLHSSTPPLLHSSTPPLLHSSTPPLLHSSTPPLRFSSRHRGPGRHACTGHAQIPIWKEKSLQKPMCRPSLSRITRTGKEKRKKGCLCRWGRRFINQRSDEERNWHFHPLYRSSGSPDPYTAPISAWFLTPTMPCSDLRFSKITSMLP